MSAKDTAQALKDLLQNQVAPAQALVDQMMAEMDAEVAAAQAAIPPSDNDAIVQLQAALDAAKADAQAKADVAVQVQADFDAYKAKVKADEAQLAADIG